MTSNQPSQYTSPISVSSDSAPHSAPPTLIRGISAPNLQSSVSKRLKERFGDDNNDNRNDKRKPGKLRRRRLSGFTI